MEKVTCSACSKDTHGPSYCTECGQKLLPEQEALQWERLNEPHGTFTVVVEDCGMDSGCLFKILRECMNHGKILDAVCEGTDIHGQPYKHSQMFSLDLVASEPEGEC